MNRREFEELRNFPGKYIENDIEFRPIRGMGPNLVFRDVPVHNNSGLRILLNGTFKPGLNAVTYNFVVSGLGPICRVDVNGSIHGNAGRTHKHELQHEHDPASNLPYATPRPDLAEKSASDVWEILCRQANIEHRGRFLEP